MQMDFSNHLSKVVNNFMSATFLMRQIKAVFTEMVSVNGPACFTSGLVASLGTLGDQDT
jgi:hypothetical protein